MRKPVSIENRPSGLKSDSLTPDAKRRLTLILGGGIMTLALMAVLTDSPQSAPSRTRTKAAPRVEAAAPPPAAAAPPRTLKDYSSLMGRNLFKPLVSNANRRGAVKTAVPSVPPGIKPPPGMASLPPLTLRDVQTLPRPRTALKTDGWQYIGSVTVDNVSFALLQHTPSGDTGYYRVGEEFGGGVIRAIGTQALVLATDGGETLRLPKTSGAPTTPAPTPGAAGTAPPTAASPAAPNAPQGEAQAAGNPVAPGTPGVQANPDGNREERRQRRRERREMFRQNGMDNSGGNGGGRRQRQQRESYSEQGVALAPGEGSTPRF